MIINLKGLHFEEVVILMSVRWHLADPPCYRNIEELMAERGVYVDLSAAVKGLLNTLLYRQENSLNIIKLKWVVVGGWMRLM